MSGELHVDELLFIGPRGAQRYEFPRRVTVITGPVGSGKTSILNGIAYALGASWIPPKKIRPALDSIEIKCRLAGERVTIHRPLRGSTGTVAVSQDGAPSQLLPVAGDQEISLSTFLLTRLGLPVVRVPEKLKELTEDDRAVSFADVLSLMYLDQDQIDGSVGFTGARHVKWRQTAAVIYGFTTSEIARIQSELGEANTQLSRVSRYINEVERFLEAVTIPGESDEERERERVASTLAVVERELQEIRAGAAGPTEVDMRTLLSEAERQLFLAKQAASEALGDLNAMYRVRAQLQSDLGNVQLAERALRLRELEFEQCPRCMTPLPATETPGRCRLCHQPETTRLSPLSTEVEVDRLRRQQVETEALLADALARQTETSATVDQKQAHRDAVAADWNEASAAALAPRLERIVELSQRKGELLRIRNTLDRSFRMQRELSAARTERDRLRGEAKRLEGELTAARAQLKRARALIRTFGEMYFDLLRRMEMRDLDSASIDEKTFLPLVNGEGIKPLSSGGMKTMASFAYFLAALQLRLAGEPSLLPRFMMIDSPRKGHGKNQADEAAMGRFYRTLGTFARLSASSDFQVIVADNDSPIQDRELFHVIAFTEAQRSVDIAELMGVDAR